jgi:hypothetical protein
MITRSQTKKAREYAVEYGNWIIEKLREQPITEAKSLHSHLANIWQNRELWWRVMYEPAFRSKIRAQCEYYVTALASERDMTMEVWHTATYAEHLKDISAKILRGSA